MRLGGVARRIIRRNIRTRNYDVIVRLSSMMLLLELLLLLHDGIRCAPCQTSTDARLLGRHIRSPRHVVMEVMHGHMRWHPSDWLLRRCRCSRTMPRIGVSRHSLLLLLLRSHLLLLLLWWDRSRVDDEVRSARSWRKGLAWPASSTSTSLLPLVPIAPGAVASHYSKDWHDVVAVDVTVSKVV